MNKDMMKYLVIGGGVIAAYWYITHFGPTGSVSDGHASWWDTWFGSGVSAPPVTGSPGSVVVINQNPQPVITQPGSGTPVPNSTIRQQILTASAGNPNINGGYAVPDVWSYYWQQVTGRSISSAQLTQAFPPVAGTGTGAPLNLDQFLTGLAGVGLSGVQGVGAIVSVPAAPSLPSMNFGGSFRRPGLRGMGGRGMGNGGQTIQ